MKTFDENKKFTLELMERINRRKSEVLENAEARLMCDIDLIEANILFVKLILRNGSYYQAHRKELYPQLLALIEDCRLIYAGYGPEERAVMDKSFLDI